MTPTVQLIRGDSLALFNDPSGFRNAEGKLVKADACVTDPPYELGFMGRAWDSTGIAYNKALWRGLIAVLKPGAHLLAFSGSRTAHRMTCAIEDAGWDIRDVLMWLYGQGFPKSLDISKAIDKKLKVKREVIGTRTDGVGNTDASMHKHEGFAASREKTFDVTAPGSDKARTWAAGWGTALKPAYEPITMARAPFAQMKVDDKAIVENVLARGTGAINIEGCRIGTDGGRSSCPGGDDCHCDTNAIFGGTKHPVRTRTEDFRRWPANILLDEDAAAALDEQTGDLGASRFFGVFPTWVLDPAHSAGDVFSPTSEVVASVLDRAVIAGSHGAKRLSAIKELSTPVTLSELRKLAETLIETMQRFAVEFSSAFEHEKLYENGSLVRCVGTSAPIDITTIIVNRWRSDGSVDAIMFDITPANVDHGEVVSGNRFNYCAKPSRKERDYGCDDLPMRSAGEVTFREEGSAGLKSPRAGAGRTEGGKNFHTTVKPIELMRWLIRLVTPPGGTVIDPFLGSGTTGIAAVLEGFNFIGIEKEADYFELASHRVNAALRDL